MYVYIYIYGICLQEVLISLTMLPYKTGFGYPIGFQVSVVSVLGMDFHPKRCSVRVWVLSSDFGFECPNTPPIRTRSVAILIQGHRSHYLEIFLERYWI